MERTLSVNYPVLRQNKRGLLNKYNIIRIICVYFYNFVFQSWRQRQKENCLFLIFDVLCPKHTTM